MRALRKFRTLLRLGRGQQVRVFPRAQDELAELTRRFCESTTFSGRVRRATQLFLTIWSAASDRLANVRLLRWIRLLEQDRLLRASFRKAWDEMLAEFDFVPLFTETGLPSHHAFSSEVMRRLFERILPSARNETDVVRFLAGVFSSSTEVSRFVRQDQFAFARLAALLWPAEDSASTRRIYRDFCQALRLLSSSVAGRGTSSAIRRRGHSQSVEESPFYHMIFVTETLLDADTAVTRSTDRALWQDAVRSCYEELEQVHLHMEEAGVSAGLVYDLRSIEATLERMEILMSADEDRSEPSHLVVRQLVESLLQERRNDTRLRVLFRDNLNLLARKTVERTGRGGEHYIAHNRRDYWLMWRAGAGGGLLTVFTAAVKMKVVESKFPLAIEGFLIGSDYAISFVLLQIFGLALATKQPSMTAATLAGIVRENRGVARWSKIGEFAADICRTQLAAAISNVAAVCIGAVLFEQLWEHLFRQHYLPAQSAQHVYQTLHPFTSGTAIFAAVTGVLLWLAAMIGGWFENFIVYHRVPEAIAQHPLGVRFGFRSMQRAADWLEAHAASWSTSIVLGYLLGFSPVVARFFGVPLDVRHVTLSTGTLALAAARFGTDSFGHGWLYAAMAGLAITFVMNLGVSFSIASAVALRAYDVPRAEQMRILRFLLQELLKSPAMFLLPVREERLSIVPGVKQPENEELEADTRRKAG